MQYVLFIVNPSNLEPSVTKEVFNTLEAAVQEWEPGFTIRRWLPGHFGDSFALTDSELNQALTLVLNRAKKGRP